MVMMIMLQHRGLVQPADEEDLDERADEQRQDDSAPAMASGSGSELRAG